MKRLRRWLLLGATTLACLVLVAAFLEPNQILTGLVQGDDFVDWRPTRYWREMLRREGEAGKLSDETIRAFKLRESCVLVLRTCARDPDRNVRLPAVMLIGKPGLLTLQAPKALPVVREALNDSDLNIRLQAILALHRIGSSAFNAGPDLVALLKDPDAQVRFWAERALWDINKKLAIEAAGWKTFDSPRWGFSASFPADPLEEQKPGLIEADKLTVHSFSANHGATYCAVAVTEHPPELFKGTDTERLDAGRDLLLFGMGENTKLDEKPFARGSIKGREYTVEKTIERNGIAETYIFRSIVFWVDRRQYQVVATYSEELSVLPAVDYFLDSFKLRENWNTNPH